MAKKHIITLGSYSYAFDSVSAAIKAMELISKAQTVVFVCKGDYKEWHYTPDLEYRNDATLKLNEEFRAPVPKPAKASKPLALPKPARGTILCICEKSYVAPKESCPHCGRPFSESHNRTHGTKVEGTNLRLL